MRNPRDFLTGMRWLRLLSATVMTSCHLIPSHVIAICFVNPFVLRASPPHNATSALSNTNSLSNITIM